MVAETAFGLTMEEAIRRSLNLLSARGTTRDANLSESSLVEVEEKGKTDVGRRRTAFFLGPTFPLEACNSQELVEGRPTCQLLDYGDEIRLNQKMREQLGTGEDKERNQRVPCCLSLLVTSGLNRGNLTGPLGRNVCRSLPNNIGKRSYKPR